MKKIILAGGGGHALSLLESLPPHLEAVGYTAPAPAPSMHLPLLGDDSAAAGYKDSHLFHIAFVYAGLPVMKKRRNLIDKYTEAGVAFATIISPHAIVTPNSRVADGCAILSGAIVNRAVLAPHVVVNSGAIVEHDCHIGANTFIGPGTVIGGNVTIGEDCFIGLGARLKNGITIAPGVSVAMGATVDRDLLEPGIYHGFPLRLHRLK